MTGRATRVTLAVGLVHTHTHTNTRTRRCREGTRQGRAGRGVGQEGRRAGREWGAVNDLGDHVHVVCTLNHDPTWATDVSKTCPQSAFNVATVLHLEFGQPGHLHSG